VYRLVGRLVCMVIRAVFWSVCRSVGRLDVCSIGRSLGPLFGCSVD